MAYEDSGGDTDPHPCIWFIPGVDESGLQGCPYYVPGEDNNMVDPACWIAVPYQKIVELLNKDVETYQLHSDDSLDKEEQNYNKDMIKRLIG